MAKVRLATSEDLPEIQDLVRRSYERYVPRMGKPPAPMLDDYGALVGNGRVSVLEEEGRIAGLLVLLPQSDHLLLDNIAVDPSFQGRGLGRQLAAEAEMTAMRLELPEVRLYTNVMMTENIALYRHLGFEETHRAEQDGYQRIFMRKTVVLTRDPDVKNGRPDDSDAGPKKASPNVPP
jgi:ribosomal protein S18 acetylase RimI-like enzyme